MSPNTLGSRLIAAALLLTTGAQMGFIIAKVSLLYIADTNAKRYYLTAVRRQEEEEEEQHEPKTTAASDN